MKAINLNTFNLSLLTAKEDVLNPRSSTDWALFRYDGFNNNLKLSDSGVGGLVELVKRFHRNRGLYGLCQVTLKKPEHQHIVLISWIGDDVDKCRREEYASHQPAIKAFFKEAHMFVSAKTLEDVTEDRISAMFSTMGTPAVHGKSGSCSVDKEESVGTNYKRTIAVMEIQRMKRESFWARSDREEDARKAEEKRRAFEERRLLEIKRIQQEHREAEERERKMIEKENRIQERRRIEEEKEAAAQKQEMIQWEQQKKEHEEEMRASFRRSESIEKAAEAAALVSQRSINPLEFFRQLSSSSSCDPPNPASPLTGKPPFRHFQRSLTERAFIFKKSDLPAPTSKSSPLVEISVAFSPTSSSQASTQCSQHILDTVSDYQPSIPPASPGSLVPSSTLPPSRSPPDLLPPSLQTAPFHATTAPDPSPLSPSVSPPSSPTTPDLLACQSQAPSISTLLASIDPSPADVDILLSPETLNVTVMHNAVHTKKHASSLKSSDVDLEDLEVDILEIDLGITKGVENEECGEEEAGLFNLKTGSDPHTLALKTDLAIHSTEEYGVAFVDHHPDAESAMLVTDLKEQVECMSIEKNDFTEKKVPFKEPFIDSEDREREEMQWSESPLQASAETGKITLFGQADEEETYEVTDDVDQSTLQVQPTVDSKCGIINEQKSQNINDPPMDCDDVESLRSIKEDQSCDLIYVSTRQDGIQEDSKNMIETSKDNEVETTSLDRIDIVETVDKA
ncbi:uncharacterized protein [Paramormyrops kingsleyae]|uniref:uncharacterized protein isoform X2 n=1 Tax=Paramormyrops kingsleyae TaxID=1676925 RepID=UPI000CD5F592|nr:drebrin-like isoform X2 [Paramormyrops kingsleyae]